MTGDGIDDGLSSSASVGPGKREDDTERNSGTSASSSIEPSRRGQYTRRASDTPSSVEPGTKRKVRAEILEKVHWTDESDGLPSKPKKRRAKRKSGKEWKVTEETDSVNDVETGTLPDYLVSRRREFEARKKHGAGLMLPPDYSDVELNGLSVPSPSSTPRAGQVKERPEFDERSGVKVWRAHEDIELPQSGGVIPAPIAQYLRDYQVDGVRFLHRKFVHQQGGILGDDMGLGKTVQVAAFLAVAFGKTGDERDARRMRQMRQFGNRWYPRVLVICPGSLISNWKNELNRWGWWHVDMFHGPGKDDVLGTARSGLLEIMITTYETYKNARSSVNMVQWDAVIADECHRMKDPYSQTTKAMMEVNALCRVGLTGTAIQNRYEELWTLLDWTNPGHTGTQREWSAAITRPLTVGQSHDATVAQLSLARQTAKKLVQNLLPRYFLRRMKTLIAHQLPRKTDRVVFCPLTEAQREAYEKFLDSEELRIIRTASDLCALHGMDKGWCCNVFLPDGRPWQARVFPSMVVLQKLANHLTLLVPSTTDMDDKHASELATLRTCMPSTWEGLYANRDRISSLVQAEYCGKWKVLKKLLRFWHGSGDKVLVFSHSVRLLRILQHLFTRTSYTVSYLDGTLSYEARQAVVDEFNRDPARFAFLISTKAGGVGLNITSANKVVIVDPHWNPAYDLQAQDRAYRIGQTRDVEVFRLISLGTIEEIVYARQVYKQQQANIGYTASSERRYFRGVQQDAQRKGEIFGLANLFTYHGDVGLLRDIVNKTNIAEARAGVSLAEVDINEEDVDAVKDEEEDAGLSQLADLLTAKDEEETLKKKTKPRSDAVQAILASAGVEYTHDNSEVIGSSRVEEQLSRRAELASGLDGQRTLFKDGVVEEGAGEMFRVYRPPGEVCLRQFCEMARELGFEDATEFAVVVEGWTGEERRDCLEEFFKRRELTAMKEDVEDEMKDDKKWNVKAEERGSSRDIKDQEEENIRGRAKVEKMEDEIKLEKKIKLEDLKVKDEERSKDIKDEIKLEDVKAMDGRSKRTSIFLQDSDSDDEL